MPPAGPADPDRPVGEVVSRALLVDLARMVAHEPGTRTGEDPEELHQMRVATRRLRSTLRTFRPVLDREWADGLRDRLRDLAGALGEVRDLDVRLARLDAEVVEGAAAAGLAEVRAHVAADRAAARERLVAVMDRPDHQALLTDLLAAARSPRCTDPATPAGPALTPLVRKAWKRARAAVDDAPPHEVRIALKRLRYAAEAAEPAVGKRARKIAKAAAAGQEVLGEYQDAAVAREADLALLGQMSPTAAFALGVLVEREDRRMAEALAAWPAALARLADLPLKRWLSR